MSGARDSRGSEGRSSTAEHGVHMPPELASFLTLKNEPEIAAASQALAAFSLPAQ